MSLSLLYFFFFFYDVFNFSNISFLTVIIIIIFILFVARLKDLVFQFLSFTLLLYHDSYDVNSIIGASVDFYCNFKIVTTFDSSFKIQQDIEYEKKKTIKYTVGGGVFFLWLKFFRVYLLESNSLKFSVIELQEISVFIHSKN